jgi:phosphatidylglycerol:prolipoprotein diacylglycerol transferase
MFPTLFHIGSLAIPTYGILVALAFVAGLRVTLRLARRNGLPHDQMMNLAVYCAMAGIVGAKLFMFLFDMRDYLRNPGQIFSMETLRAAGVFHGGFIGALIFAVLYIRRQHLPAWRVMDTFSPGLVLGQGIGRLGCFAAGCCWGKECDLPWGVRFRSDEAAPVPLNKTLHPAQLYETAADLLIFAFLYRRYNRPHANGQIMGLYLVLYSVARFVIEFFREHEQSLVGPFSLTQWIALVLFAAGVLVLLRARSARPVEPAPHLVPSR